MLKNSVYPQWLFRIISYTFPPLVLRTGCERCRNLITRNAEYIFHTLFEEKPFVLQVLQYKIYIRFKFCNNFQGIDNYILQVNKKSIFTIFILPSHLKKSITYICVLFWRVKYSNLQIGVVP